jgi:hypothetical protein
MKQERRLLAQNGNQFIIEQTAAREDVSLTKQEAGAYRTAESLSNLLTEGIEDKKLAARLEQRLARVMGSSHYQSAVAKTGWDLTNG